MKLLAIIPAYNEQDCIVETIRELDRVAPDVDILVINDGSTDGTGDLCRREGYNFLDLPVNVGLSSGFQAGMKYADRQGYDCAIQFDADGQHRPEYIKPLLEAMEQSGADIVIGSRFVTKKKDVSARMAGSALISFLIRLTTGKRLSDPTSGMRMYNRRAMAEFVKRYDFGPEPDTLANLIRKGFKVVEVQVEMRDRETGESYLSFSKSIMYMARAFVSILIVQWLR
ncbi:glycosyltransferase [Raoultibacter timonensis]|uniref:Glycosyl transferase n=1 Tax=Raoultibacter timonensis TaxID=1907662 RepID=A0ABM7WI90_9ACTN|nr:glycosyltransferase [Raoultibacter timonensis]BDE95997.1 putative glycosyl transferase [Raoultibacter timonensis]BDF50601.1 putative glycosyl transferase [Raoultibacter timonensis]